MKTTSQSSGQGHAESPEQAAGGHSILRFWMCFLLCLAVLGLLSGLMLAGFFLLMGYRIL